MKFVLLPCEIYHREFDAKLLLACHLFSKYGISSLIGYDKYFADIARSLPGAILLEKSCSNIMHKSRINPVKSLGGYVIVNDEGGFNNLESYQKNLWYSRVDRHAASSIDIYGCWGTSDYEYFSDIKELYGKMQIVGNCRSLLLGAIGRHLYADKISSLKEIYGDFVLCPDNFCVEHRRGNYQMPNYNAPSNVIKEALAEWDTTWLYAAKKREIYCEYLTILAQKNPSLSFVLRPHPVSNPSWWLKRFWQFRNIHIVGIMNVEPWIHASKAMLSMGCTTAIQSMIAGKPVIEVTPKDVEQKLIGGLGHKLSRFNARTPLESLQFLNSLICSDFDLQNALPSHASLDRLWHKSSSQTVTHPVAESICQLASLPKVRVSRLGFQNYLAKFRAEQAERRMQINLEKWPNSLFDEELKKVDSISRYLGNSRIPLMKVENGLYCVGG